MFARLLEFNLKPEKKEEFVRVIKDEIVPILKKQPGFVEVLPFIEDVKAEKMVTISLWQSKREAERYAQEVSPRVIDIARPYLTTKVETKSYTLETTVCKHFVEALTA